MVAKQLLDPIVGSLGASFFYQLSSYLSLMLNMKAFENGNFFLVLYIIHICSF